jgi:multidrug efflux pump subunit AcrB
VIILVTLAVCTAFSVAMSFAIPPVLCRRLRDGKLAEDAIKLPPEHQ